MTEALPSMTFSVGDRRPAPDGELLLPVILSIGDREIGPVAWCKDEHWAKLIASVLESDHTNTLARNLEQLRQIALDCPPAR